MIETSKVSLVYSYDFNTEFLFTLKQYQRKKYGASLGCVTSVLTVNNPGRIISNITDIPLLLDF